MFLQILSCLEMWSNPLLSASCTSQLNLKLRRKFMLHYWLNVPFNSKTAHPPPPRQSLGIWLVLSSVQWGIWPKWGLLGGAFDFRIKTSVSGRKQKDFVIFWFSTWAAFMGHCSCRFHVGFSVVAVLYSLIYRRICLCLKCGAKTS